MNRDEPATKHLSMAELHAYLARVGAWHPGDPERTAMSIASEAAQVGKPSRGDHVAGPDLSAPVEPADEEEASTLIFSRAPGRRARTLPRRALLIALGATSAVLALLVSGRSVEREDPDQARSQTEVAPQRAASERAEEPPATPPPTPAAPPGTERAAVDLLLSGDTRGALDAYRRLRAQAGAPPAYALAVRLLERELDRGASSAHGPETPCTP